MLTILLYMFIIVAFFYLAVWVIYIGGFIVAAIIVCYVHIAEFIQRRKRRRKTNKGDK